MTPRRTHVPYGVLLAHAIVMLVFLGAGCGGVVEDEGPAGEEEGNIEALKEETEEYLGQTITVAGEVDEVYDERSFVVGNAEWELWDEEVLVFASQSDVMPAPPEEDVQVEVTGTVRRLVTADIEREYDWDFDSDLEAEFEDKPFIAAESVTMKSDASGESL